MRRDRIGFVFQQVNLVPFPTARENLLAVRELGGARLDDEARQRADQLLEEVDERGVAAVMVTHDDRVTDLGDRIVRMADGRLVP